MRRILVVALTSLAVVAFVPTASGAAGGLALVGVAVALSLSALGMQRQALPLAFAALAVAVGASADFATGGEAHRWLALAAVPFVVPLAGLSIARPRAALVGVVLAAGLVVGPLRALAYDPLRDRECSGCLPLPALLGHQPGTFWWVLVAGVVSLVALAVSLARTRQRIFLAVLVGAGCWALTGWQEPRGAVVEATDWALVVAALAGAATVASSVSTRTRLLRLAALFRSGGGAEAALRSALGDRSTTLSFAAGRGWIGADGLAAPAPGPEQVVSPVRVAHAEVARIIHAPDAGRADLLISSLTPELRVGIEQARLDALLRAQVRELQESRLRLVEATDEERRCIERDLHDGAQQHVLALGFDVRRELAGDPSDPTLQACLAATTEMLGELRTLARGAYPALLTGAGLAPALEALGPSVAVRSLPEQRFSPGIERTAYLLVSELAADGPVDITAAVEGHELVVHVQGGHLAGHSLVRERVKTLGGTLSAVDDRTEARIPCA